MTPPATTVVIVGAGGLGSPLALALAASGIGRLVLVDDDVVDLSNLPRQILFRTEDLGRPKVLAARDALARRFATVVEPVRARFDEGSARALVHDATVVCDGSDDLATKFLVNDVCTALGRPFVIAGVVRQTGLVHPVRPGRDACYRCLYEAPPPPDDEGPTCADAGVLGPTCAEVAAWQARAALALATGDDPHHVLGRIFLLDGAQRRTFSCNPRPDCLACGRSIAA